MAKTWTDSILAFCVGLNTSIYLFMYLFIKYKYLNQP